MIIGRGVIQLATA